MVVKLAPSGNNNSSKVDLSTISNTKAQRVSRLRRDLNKFFSEEDAKFKAHQLGLPYIDLYGYPISARDLSILTREESQTFGAGCFQVNNKEALIASPYAETLKGSELEKILISRGYKPQYYICSDNSYNKILDTYKNVVRIKQTADDISLNENKINDFLNSGVDLTNLTSILRNSSVTEIIEMVLIVALQNDASDIHFEADKTGYVIKLRIDGVLHSFGEIGYEMKKRVESRVKLISGLKLNVDNVPQDGRFSFNVKGKEIDVRVSMLPSNYGYSIVMRLLGNNEMELKPENLGFRSTIQNQVIRAVEKPQGLVLTCGPTGSGKTTTLYTFLNHLNDGNRKIITIEDPIEYKLQGIAQTQIDKEAGYTFSAALKSILRQDPDVVMVGEIRDPETAEIAVQASLTGHLVLSTLHTNDAVGAVTRLLEMDIKGYLLADALSLVIGQRLVRRICNHCQKSDDLDAQTKQDVIQAIKKLPEEVKKGLPQIINLKTSQGCSQCNNLRYKGRIGIYEVLLINRAMREVISQENPSIYKIREEAQKSGMVTMYQDAVLKIIQGITDIEEVENNII
jgi:type IV pilus assembly protein PilB